jgi:hypothetical protein
LVQATPPSVLEVVAADEPWTTDQELPFHISSSGVSVEPKSSKPAATQKLVVTHETWLSVGLVAPDGVDKFTGAHVLPFHISA